MLKLKLKLKGKFGCVAAGSHTAELSLKTYFN
jgi:hypothetical protein